MTVIVDSGGANIGSVVRALRRLGVEDAPLTDDAEQIRAAERVILPGVGAAATAMRKLRSNGLDALIPTLQQPVLGICLGMQLLCRRSAEGNTSCLGVFDLDVERFAGTLRVPHMGWNSLRAEHDSPLLHGISDGDYAYFVHSYYVPMGAQTLASSDYGARFSAMLQAGNFYAAQFHPERSARCGARILKNFLELS